MEFGIKCTMFCKKVQNVFIKKHLNTFTYWVI